MRSNSQFIHLQMKEGNEIKRRSKKYYVRYGSKGIFTFIHTRKYIFFHVHIPFEGK